MSFPDAVRSVLTQYFQFNGRSRRSEYWWWTLAYVILAVIANIIDAAIGAQVVATILALGLLLPNLGVAVRRLHDTGRSGFWIFIGLIPLVGWIILLVFYVGDSQPGTNKYGPSPKEAVAV